MPIYDFSCSICGLKFEVFNSYSEKNITCPACGEMAIRLPCAPALHGSMARGREAAMRSLDEGHTHCSTCNPASPDDHTH